MKKFFVVSLLILVLNPLEAFAGWSASLGYNNPPGATYGLNFMYLWTNWAFEAGIGGVQQTSTNSGGQEAKTTSTLGDINLKYLFSSGVFRPYLQGGMGSSVSVTNASGVSAAAGVGGGYVGGGIFLLGNPIYVYGSINTGLSSGNSSFVQFGVGYDF